MDDYSKRSIKIQKTIIESLLYSKLQYRYWVTEKGFTKWGRKVRKTEGEGRPAK
jgi:hypothetical protein